jgi:hypothetical protein
VLGHIHGEFCDEVAGGAVRRDLDFEATWGKKSVESDRLLLLLLLLVLLPLPEKRFYRGADPESATLFAPAPARNSCPLPSLLYGTR